MRSLERVPNCGNGKGNALVQIKLADSNVILVCKIAASWAGRLKDRYINRLIDGN